MSRVLLTKRGPPKSARIGTPTFWGMDQAKPTKRSGVSTSCSLWWECTSSSDLHGPAWLKHFPISKPADIKIEEQHQEQVLLEPQERSRSSWKSFGQLGKLKEQNQNQLRGCHCFVGSVQPNTKLGYCWRPDGFSRQQTVQVEERSRGVLFSIGRVLRSKNGQPYPRTQASRLRFERV